MEVLDIALLRAYTDEIDSSRDGFKDGFEYRLCNWFMRIILWWEEHEAKEIFTFRGKIVFDPHKPSKDNANQK